MQPEHRRVCEHLDLTRRHELCEPRDASLLDDDPGGGQHDRLRLRGGHVRALLVERPAPLVEPPEALLVPRQWPPAAADTSPGRRRIDVDPHRQRLLAQRPPDARRLDRAAPERQNRRPLVLERLDRRVSLEHAELGLPSLLEQLRHRLPGRLRNLAVEVDEPPAEPLRDLGAERRLARAHEADERDVPV